MKVNTIPGACYALTCTVDCTVHAILHGSAPVMILETSAAGQYIFVAPSDAVEVSDDAALVTQSFKGAVLGSSAQDGGIRNGQDASLNKLTAATVNCTGAASFSSDVTMAQTFNVAQLSTLKKLAIFNEEYSFFSVETGRALWRNPETGCFRLDSNNLSTKEVVLEITKNSTNSRARISKPNQTRALRLLDVPNCEEGDSRWVKFKTDVTDAQYEQDASAGTLDATTLYVTSDGGKVYLGSHALN